LRAWNLGELSADDSRIGVTCLQSTEIDVGWWGEAQEIFAPIQAWEAAGYHRGNFAAFETAIRERLEWGARITPDEIGTLRGRHEDFKARMDDVLAEHGLVMLPAAPVAQLMAGADHSNTRKRLLRYTAPFSLAGVPAVTIPCSPGGMQLAAAREQDEALLQLAALVGAKRKTGTRD
jgi:Asp-tRNA(Asn)/Glu-tRNA(Gln) amidotransferase A subunit family amidase